LALALVLVLGVHFLLLGDASLRQLWASPDEAVTPPPFVLATRMLPPVAPTQPQTTAANKSKQVKPRPKTQRAAPSGPVAAPGNNSEAPAPDPLPAAPDPATVAAEAVAPTTTPSTTAGPPQRLAFPPPVQLDYDVFGDTDGQKDVVTAAIVWNHDETNYESSLLVTKFGFRLRQWTSKGALTATGLTPTRFGEKGLRKSEVAAHFVWDENKIIFSSNAPETALTPGAQDHLSMFMQLASMWAGQPDRYAAGSSIAFQSVGPRQSEMWTFVISPEDTISVPGGTLQAIKLTREASGDYSTKAEVWLAPLLAYLPARIRLTEANGNVLDIVWTGGKPP
jgi:hypothetical protein